MNFELMTAWIDGDKLFVRSDALTTTPEFYLPDATQSELERFLALQTSKIAGYLARERPWRKPR